MKSAGLVVALFITADARCNVCRESSKGTRSLANPSQSWHMSGKTWTCAYLQETVNDVMPHDNKEEGAWCLKTQAVADEYCTCNGPPSDDGGGNIHDMHPACDICKGQDFDFVPSTNAKLVADTGGFGHQNCDGLYHAASQGIFSGHSCSIVQKNAGPTCCHIDFPVKRGAFENFADKFGKAYNGPEHAAEHEQVYEANLQWAAEHTTGEVVFGENMFADLTSAQFGVAAGLGGYTPNRMGGLPHLGVHVHNGEALADSVDWTTEGAVTPVKNQGQCGSCWAFSTTGGMEGAWQIASSQLVSMSEQQLVDCSTDNAGCNGGDMGLALDFAGTVNVATESSYPYKGTGGSCKSSYTTAIPAGGVTGYKSVGQSSDDLKSALMTGPVSVAIEADQLAFQLYKGGVLESGSGFFKHCGTKLDHGVLAVGYTANAFKVKNSWGAGWGEDGYIQLSTNGNTCGIHSDATLPVVSASVSV